jgi:hypothetical protein
MILLIDSVSTTTAIKKLIGTTEAKNGRMNLNTSTSMEK